MACVKSRGDILSVHLGSRAIVKHINSKEVRNLECDPKFLSTTEKNENSSNLDETVFIPCSDISNCSQWFIFSYKKSLLLWKTSDWSLVGNAELQRSPCKIKFSADSSKIIIIDKSGDVFIYTKDNLSLGGHLILGHLALLFDVIITPDEKFIISCDRDEKIRVSCYPNAYNIKSYCLGHEEFVTSLQIVPHCSKILISVSGDDTLRLWDFENGIELLKYSVIGDIDTAFVEKIEDLSFEESVAIIKSISFQLDDNESIICIICNNYRGCLVYSIKGSMERLLCSKVQSIALSSVPCDINLNNNILWVITSSGKYELHALQWNSNNKNFCIDICYKNIKNSVEEINKELSSFVCAFKNKISLLYKKQYVGLPDYLKRKYSDDSADITLKKDKVI